MAKKEVVLGFRLEGDDKLRQLQTNLDQTAKRLKDLNKAEREGVVTAEEASKKRADLNVNLIANRNALRDQQREILKNNDALKKNSGFVAGIRKGIGEWATSMIGLTAALAAGGKAISFMVGEFTEANAALRTARQLFNETNVEIEKTTSNALALASTFDKEVNDVLKSASILSNEFGISSSEATALIEEGFRKGADVNGEFLELLKEYPAQLKTVGLSAEESIAIITQTEQAGIFSDKGIDAIKEAGIRLREFTPATKDAIDAIGLSSAEMQKGLKDGSISLFEATQQISAKMAELPPNSQMVGTAIADIFGGAGEDAGLRFITGLSQVDTSLEDLEDKVTSVQDAELEMAKVWEDFVVGTTEGGTIIGDTYALLIESATDYLQILTNASRLDFASIGVEQLEGMNEKVGNLNVTMGEMIKAREQDQGIFEALTQAYKDGTYTAEQYEAGIRKLADGYRRLTDEEKKALAQEKAFQAQATGEEGTGEGGLTDAQKAEIKKKAEAQAKAEREAKKKAEEKYEADLEAGEEGSFDDEINRLVEEEIQKAEIPASIRQQVREQENDQINEFVDKEIEANQRAADAQKEIEALKANAVKEGLNITAGAFDAFAGLAKQGSAEQKALATASALVSTYQAAQQAYASQFLPIPTPSSPFRAAAAAGVAIVQGLGRVKQIQGIQFEDGGILHGASHANGGIPFTVGGVGGFEAEGGEAIINKRSTEMFAPLLSAINEAGGGQSFFKSGGLVRKFQNGGLAPSNVGVTAAQQALGTSTLDLEVFSDTIVSGINDKQVINVATETSDVASDVINTRNEATF